MEDKRGSVDGIKLRKESVLLQITDQMSSIRGERERERRDFDRRVFVCCCCRCRCRSERERRITCALEREHSISTDQYQLSCSCPRRVSSARSRLQARRKEEKSNNASVHFLSRRSTDLSLSQRAKNIDKVGRGRQTDPSASVFLDATKMDGFSSFPRHRMFDRFW